jgi:hypothetical protein
MRWVVKTALQQALGLIPPGIADRIYHWLQFQARGIPVDLQGQRGFLQEMAACVSNLRGRSLSGLRIVELGSGWHPVLPLLLVREFGAAQVWTSDVRCHYSPARIA